MGVEPAREGHATARVRHALIRRIIASHEVHSQADLVRYLEQEGVRSTQATVSRDLATLEAHKVWTSDGRRIYALPAEGPTGGLVHGLATGDAAERLRELGRSFVVGARRTDNLLLLHSPIGAANFLGSGLDQLHLDDVLGSIAGNDTVLVVAKDGAAALRIEQLLTSAPHLGD